MNASFSTPYAYPQGQGPAVPLQGAIGPYVPKAVRVAPAPLERTTVAESLPWIDAFLAVTPAFGATAIPSAAEAVPVTAERNEAPPAADTLRWYRYDADAQLPSAPIPEPVPVAPAVTSVPITPTVSRRDTESAEAAAMALELLALRVRAGELPLSGYDPSMGDAAALVAALAALLGVRLGD